MSQKKRLRIGASLEQLEEKNLLSFVMPPADTGSAPAPTVVVPPAYVETQAPSQPRIDLSAPAWPTSPAQPPVYGPYDPNDPLQKGVTPPPTQPYYGPVLPQPGPSIYDPKPGPMPPPPSLIPPQLPS